MYQRASFQGSVRRLAQERWKLCQVVLMTTLEGPMVLIEIWNLFFFFKEISLFQIFSLLIYEIPPSVQEKRGS